MEGEKCMITTGCIPKINPDDFDEVWWIVRSPDTISVKEKLVLLVSELAPSPELFRDYRQAFHAGRFGTEYFQNVYVPWFLKDLEKNLEAPVTAEDIEKIATSVHGLYKNVDHKVYRVYLNKADILPDSSPAEHIVEDLTKQGTIAAYGSLREAEKL